MCCLKKILNAGLAAALMLALISVCGSAHCQEFRIVKKPRGKAAEASIVIPELRPDGALRIRIPADSISSNLEYISIHRAEWNAAKGDKGWYLLPSGALVEFLRDSGELRSPLPMTMFGVKTASLCEMAIIKSLAYESQIYVRAKNGKYEIWLHIGTKNLGDRAYEDFVIDLYQFKGEDANYSAMGRKYRQWQLSGKGVVPLRERVKNNEVLKKSVGNILVRVSHGIKTPDRNVEDQSVENEPRIHIKNTFKDMANLMLEMKSLGVDSCDIHSVGWNKSGHDGRYPQLLPVEPLFGGEAGLREAIKTAKDLGYQISCHTNYTAAFKIAENWDDALISRNVDGSMQKCGIWSGGMAYRTCPKQVCALRLKEDMDIIQNLGFNGMHHIDVITCLTPQPCFSQKHFCTRADTVKCWRKVMLECRRRFGGFSSEASYDFDADCTDFIFYVSGYPSHLPSKNPLISGIVPIWQIVYHGIILSNPFWDTVDATYEFERGETFKYFDSKNERILKLVEFGGRPCFYWTNYKKLGAAPIKEAYDLYQPLKYLQYEFLEEHRSLAPGVFLSRYGDGSETVVNYSGKDFPYKGETVKAKNYKLFKAK